MPVSSNDKDHLWLTIYEVCVKMRSCLFWRPKVPLLWRDWGRSLETCQGTLARDRYMTAEAWNAKRWTTHAEAVKISRGQREVGNGGGGGDTASRVRNLGTGRRQVVSSVNRGCVGDRQAEHTSVSQPFSHLGTPDIVFHIPRSPYL